MEMQSSLRNLCNYVSENRYIKEDNKTVGRTLKGILNFLVYEEFD